jgi:hypothetical protein
MNNSQFVWAYILTVGPIVGSILIYLLAMDAKRKGDRKRNG